ncbi:unnamed protein product [marine sediment metagenome]|uniref:Uncharacterized protein n=1 Tax=marine sediment metagenome TaxID=412755 RepID=X1LNU3_9ZZZZ
MNVGIIFRVRCKIISTKNWHKYVGYDDRIKISYKVLPPLNDR